MDEDDRIKAERLGIRRTALESMLENIREVSCLVLQGGAALQFEFGTGRHTKGVDFVVSGCFDNLFPYLIGITKPLHVGEREIGSSGSRAHRKGNNIPGFIITTYKVGEEYLELRIFEGESCEPFVSNRYPPLKVENPNEIYSRKMAIILKQASKDKPLPRNHLFDLDPLTLNWGATTDLKRIKEYAKIQGTPNIVTPEVFRQVVKYLQNPVNQTRIRHKLQDSLLPKYLEANKMDFDYFRAISFNHFEMIF